MKEWWFGWTAVVKTVDERMTVLINGVRGEMKKMIRMKTGSMTTDNDWLDNDG